MSKETRYQLKKWFAKGLYPIESHFHAWIDSFWHKDDSIPMSSIFNLTSVLNSKSDSNHIHNRANATVDGFMSSSDKTKLDGIATKANNYTHPSTAGNKHIPVGGATDNVLKYSASGTAVWGFPTTLTSKTISATPTEYNNKVIFLGDEAKANHGVSGGTGAYCTVLGFGAQAGGSNYGPNVELIVGRGEDEIFYRKDSGETAWGAARKLISAVKGGKININDIPTGTSDTTVALGNHTHEGLKNNIKGYQSSSLSAVIDLSGYAYYGVNITVSATSTPDFQNRFNIHFDRNNKGNAWGVWNSLTILASSTISSTSENHYTIPITVSGTSAANPGDYTIVDTFTGSQETKKMEYHTGNAWSVASIPVMQGRRFGKIDFMIADRYLSSSSISSDPVLYVIIS